MRHIVTAGDLSASELHQIFNTAKQLQSGRLDALSNRYRGRILASVFYEPSTRTRFSFEAAMLKLGGSIISTENAVEFSSAAKGESLEDTIRVISGYADVIVFRNKMAGSASIAAGASEVPLINGGDGNNEHPTQAFLDLYTILENCPEKKLHVLFFGDNRDSRTVRSLAYLLATRGKELGLSVERVSFAGLPRIGECGTTTVTLLEQAGIEVTFCGRTLPMSADVVYVTRSQKERRTTDDDPDEPTEVLVYPLSHASVLAPSSIIMHPLPRNAELPTEIDALPQAKYFEQSKNGLYIRMALLEFLLAYK